MILITLFTGFGVYVIIEPAISKLNRNDQISVDGIAKKNVTPDIAYINISAILTGTSAADLKKQADTALTKTVTELKALNIPEGKIQTTYSVTPKYDKDYQNIVGYTANPTLIVKAQDFTLVDKVIEIAQNNKLILVNNVYFTLEDPVKAKEQLRDEAIAAAKAKAEKLAQETGIRLGNIINISESSYQPYLSNGNMKTTVANDLTTGTAPSSQSDSTFNPGETEITLTIYLTYSVY